MINYDFTILQPTEFENLTRDLLQKKENIFIESFTDGRDNGIDLRYSTSRDGKTIVQAKRYKDYSSLKTTLKHEAVKAKKLSPDRYIISTSVGLTPDNKDEIISIFNGQGVSIKSEDILSKSDLNNLLGKYPEVEKSYYKLWLASSSVLESIIHKRTENYSNFELNDIREEIANYVMNPCFDEANIILKEYHYVIISGIPGIGKTTLARMLVYNYLANGFDEFVYMDSIDSAITKLQKGKKQVFFYDDFLGRIMLDIRENHFENKLIHFIREIGRRSDAIFILTTREYILQDANLQFEKIKIENIEIAKCILNIETYSESIRAHILYNHICAVDIPTTSIESLLKNRNYMKLIQHKNFNPRIIEGYLKNKRWKVTPEKFFDELLQSFDFPTSVWDYTFLKLSDLSQNALVILATMGGCVLLSDWERGTRYFCEEMGVQYSENQWRNTLKILEETFINISQGHKDQHYVVFHNPSILDYLVGYIRERPSVIIMCIKHAVFVDQLFTLFKEKRTNRLLSNSFIPIEPIHYDVLHNTYKELLPFNEKCKLFVSKQTQEYKDNYSIIRTIIKIWQSQPSIIIQFPDIIKDIINEESIEEIAYAYGDDLVELIDFVGVSAIDVGDYTLSKISLQGISSIFEFKSWWRNFRFEAEEYSEREQESVADRLDYLSETSIKACSNKEEYDEVLNEIVEISDLITYWNHISFEKQIIEKLSEIEEKTYEDEEYDHREMGFYRENVDKENYDNMFASLLFK